MVEEDPGTRSRRRWTLDLMARGKLSLEDPVSLYLPGFDRKWSVVQEDEKGPPQM